VPRWLARLLGDWHRRRSKRLAAIIEDQRKHLTELLSEPTTTQHRAKHWDLIANPPRE
jgi:hypothetical protein